MKSKSKSSIVTLETSALPRKKFPLVLEGPWKKWCFFEYKRLIEIKQLKRKIGGIQPEGEIGFSEFLLPAKIHLSFTGPLRSNVLMCFSSFGLKERNIKPMDPGCNRHHEDCYIFSGEWQKNHQPTHLPKSTDSLATVNLYWWVDSEMKTYDFGPLFEGKLLGRGGGHFQEPSRNMMILRACLTYDPSRADNTLSQL